MIDRRDIDPLGEEIWDDEIPNDNKNWKRVDADRILEKIRLNSIYGRTEIDQYFVLSYLFDEEAAKKITEEGKKRIRKSFEDGK